MKQPIIENLEYLKETKEAIKEAIINKGVSVQDTDTFRSYAEKIDSIEPNNIEGLIIANPKVSAQSINPSSGYAGIKQVIINGVTSDIDENIKPENIKRGVTILDVTGNLTPNKIQDKVIVTPSTSQQNIIPSEGYDGMSEVEVLAVDSSIDEDIKPENIKNGVNILGVDGTLEQSKLQDEITVSPMTVDQIIYPDDDYDAVKKIKVDKVTSEIDSNIIPENIKKDVSILGVLGELEESKGDTDIYKVSTIEEMNNLENIKEGDICLIYSGGVYPISADSVFNSLTYNNTVVLDSVVTDFYDCMFTLEDESQGNIFGDGQAFLDMSSFNARFFIDDGGGNFTDINIQYMSNDGITYTLEEYSTKSPADLKYNFKIQDKDRFNDIFGKFLSAEDVSFSGIYQYALDENTNSLSWKYLNIKTTGTSTNVFNPATFYTSNGMITSEINRGDFRQSNIFIQSNEPETKNGLWIKLISKDGEEYNKVFNNSDIIGLISGPIDNDINMFTKEDFPISIYVNSSANNLYQSYNCCVAEVLYSYNNSNKYYNAYMLFRNGFIYLFSYQEGKIQRINIESNEIEEIYKLTAHSDASYQYNSHFNYNGVDAVYIQPSKITKGRILKFNLDNYTMEEINTGITNLRLDYSEYIEAITYKNKIFYNDSGDVFKVINLDDSTTTEIPLTNSMRTISYIDFYSFYENGCIDISYREYKSGSFTTYYIRLNLETNEVTNITEDDFISNKFGVYTVYTNGYLYNFEHKKLYTFSETGNCGSKNMIYTNIDDDSLRYMMINYNEYSIKSNLVFIYNDAIYMIGGYTITQTGTNYLYNKFKLNISDVNETYLDNKFTKLYLRLGNTSNKYNIFENIGVSVIDALYNRDISESNYESYYRNNDVKELYYGDGTSWKLIKSHTDVS